jgi:hypothetical protein
VKANPGGQIDLKAVVGREALIARLWEAVTVQSLVITAERRIGKTTVIKKMAAEPFAGWTPVYQDLESFHSAAEFALGVYRQVDQFLGRKKKLARRSKEFLAAVGGTEIKGWIKLPGQTPPPWKEVLTHAVEDLMQENDGTSRLLFLWDEMPFMLANIRNREGEQTAMQVLDHLRWLRQTHEDLRIVITGSIGLHHVITSLKEKDYSNAPVNDMISFDVPPLEPADAARLAGQLIEGEALKVPDLPAASKAIAQEADGFAFYIHHIVKGLKLSGLDATPGTIAKVVASHLVDPNDPWQLLHYRERISTYYPKDQGTVCHVLDHLAVDPKPASVNELVAMLKSVSTFDDRERLLHLLSLMARDHYTLRSEDGRLQFRFPLIRRWWKLNRGL